MARRGETVSCRCGELLTLENDRVPWHKRPGQGAKKFTCPASGAYAENWDVALACPECGGTKKIHNAAGEIEDLLCGSCGYVGSGAEFAAAALTGGISVAAEPRQHRYGG